MRALDALPRIAELSLQAARQAGSLALSGARTVAAPLLAKHRSDGESGGTRNWQPPSSRPAGEPPPPPPPPAAAPPAPPAAPRAAAPLAPPAPQPPAAEPSEPEHVDREAVVVHESADAGAAAGAGAQIRVDEPWDGYRKLTAKDVTAQLATADAATLAVVRLYESANRNRSTVLAEIDRRLATAGR